MDILNIGQGIEAGRQKMADAPLDAAHQSIENAGPYDAIEALQRALELIAKVEADTNDAAVHTSLSRTEFLRPAQAAFAATQGSHNVHAAAINQATTEVAIGTLRQLWAVREMNSRLDRARTAAHAALSILTEGYGALQDGALDASDKSMAARERAVAAADAYIAQIAPNGASDGQPAVSSEPASLDPH